MGVPQWTSTFCSCQSSSESLHRAPSVGPHAHYLVTARSSASCAPGRVADLWTDSIEEWQYVVFINKLYRRVTKPRKTRKKLWRAATTSALAGRENASLGRVAVAALARKAAVVEALERSRRGSTLEGDYGGSCARAPATVTADAVRDAPTRARTKPPGGAEEQPPSPVAGGGEGREAARMRCFRVQGEVTPITSVEIEQIRQAPKPPPEVVAFMATALLTSSTSPTQERAQAPRYPAVTLATAAVPSNSSASPVSSPALPCGFSPIASDHVSETPCRVSGSAADATDDAVDDQADGRADGLLTVLCSRPLQAKRAMAESPEGAGASTPSCASAGMSDSPLTAAPLAARCKALDMQPSPPQLCEPLAEAAFMAHSICGDHARSSEGGLFSGQPCGQSDVAASRMHEGILPTACAMSIETLRSPSVPPKSASWQQPSAWRAAADATHRRRPTSRRPISAPLSASPLQACEGAAVLSQVTLGMPFPGPFSRTGAHKPLRPVSAPLGPSLIAAKASECDPSPSTQYAGGRTPLSSLASLLDTPLDGPNDAQVVQRTLTGLPQIKGKSNSAGGAADRPPPLTATSQNRLRWQAAACAARATSMSKASHQRITLPRRANGL